MVRRSMLVGKIVGLAAAALAVGALAGCGPTDDGTAGATASGSPTTAAPSGVPASTGPSTGTSTGPSTGPNTQPGPSAQAIAACRKGGLSVKLGGESSGSGHRSVTI